MKTLKNQFNYDTSVPLSKPYNDTEIFNAYYKGYDSINNFHVLISHYKTTKQSQISSYIKKYNKIKAVTHKNLCKIYDIIGEKNQLFLVQEWCEGGNIVDYIGKQYTLDWRLAIRIFFSVLTGLNELHKAEQTHNFINLQNIEIDQNGIPKLSFKCIIYKTFYLSPQVKKNHQKTKQNDLFALGVSLYRLIYGILPFKQNKTQDFTNSVRNLPDFHPQNSNSLNQLYPICIPSQIKQLLKEMLNINPQSRYGCFGRMKNYPNDKVDTILSKQIYKKVLSNKYINIYTLKDTMQEQCFTVLHPNQKRLLKMNIVKSEKAQIEKYIQKVLVKLKSHPHQAFLNIYDYQIINEEYLAIIFSYDNQGSLLKFKEVLQSKQSFTQKVITVSVNSLIAALSKLPNRYQYLTNQSIFIKSGYLRIRHPQFPTRQFIYSLKQSKGEVNFISPQVIENKSSQVCDSWSIAVIEYWMRFNKMPNFDLTGTLILPNRQLLAKDKIMYFNDFIEKDPKERKNMLVSQKQKQSKIRKSRKSSSRQSDKSNVKLSQIKKQNIVSSVEGNNKESHIKSPKKSSNLNQSSNIENNLQKNRFMSQEFDIIEFQPPPSPKLLKNNSKQPPKKSQSFLFQLLNGYSNRTNFLQRNWTKSIRILMKCLICILLYLFLFYYNFFYINGTLLGSRNSYAQTKIQIRAFSSDSTPNINYTLVTQTPYSTNTTFYNATLDILRDSQRCVLNDYSVQSDVVEIIQSPGFGVYQVFGFLFGVFNILLACIILAKLDFCKALYLTKFEERNFVALYSWSFVNLAISSLTSCMYLIYGGLYHLKLTPCLGKSSLPALQFLMKNWVPSFAWRFCWVYFGILVAYAVIIYFVLRPNTKVPKYVYYILLALYLIGVGGRAMGKFVNQMQCVFGVCGQLLALTIGSLMLVVDLIFNCFVAKKGTKNVNDADSIQEANKTHEYLYNDDEK